MARYDLLGHTAWSLTEKSLPRTELMVGAGGVFTSWATILMAASHPS